MSLDLDTRDSSTDETLPWLSRPAAVPIILLLGLCLRLYLLSGRSMWIDESVSMQIAGSATLGDLMRAVTFDTNPPLFYILLHFWIDLFGNTDLAARLLAAAWGFTGMIGVFVLCRYGLTWKLGSSNLALLLTAVLPLHVYYSQEVRCYTMLFALAGFALAFLARAHRQGQMRLYLCFGVLQALMLYTHNIALLYCAALNLVYAAVCLACGEFNRARLKGWLASAVVALVVYAPWLPFFWKQLHNPVVSNFQASSGQPSLWDLGLVYVKMSGIWNLEGFPGYAKPLYVLAGIPVWLLVAFGIWHALKRRAALEIVLVGFLAVYPLIIFTASTCLVPIWVLRVFVPSALGVPVIAALGMGRFSTATKMKTMQRAIAVLAIVIGLFSSLLWVQTYRKEDWRKAGSFVSARVSEGDVVLVYRQFDVCALERYVSPGTKLFGILRTSATEDFLDKLVTRAGAVPRRLVVASAYSDGTMERIAAVLRGKYRVTEQESFYHVTVVVFSPVEPL